MKDDDKNEYFDNSLDFNAWQLQTSYEAPYSEVITKDVSLSNLRTKEHFQKGFVNLRLAVYLEKITTKTHVGYLVVTEDEPDGIPIHVTDLAFVKEILSGARIKEIKRLYENKPVFPKTVHNKKSTAYTLFSMSRGIMGKASDDLNTVKQEQTRTLKDETERKSFFGKKSTKWVDYEKQKNY